MMKDQNSFSELGKEVHALREYADLSGLPTLVIEKETTKIRVLLLHVLVTDPDCAKVNKLMSNFRRRLIAGGCPENIDIESFVGSVVGCVARAQENGAISLTDEFGPLLSKTFTAVRSNEDFAWALGSEFCDEVEGHLQSLLHAATAMVSYDSTKVSYASQSDIDGYFYHSYFHGMKRQTLDGLWDAVAVRKTRKNRQYEEMGALAHNFTNVFFNFLHSASEQLRCSRSLRTCIRTHLIRFTDCEDKKHRGWHQPFDVENAELRVTTADIDYAHETGRFNFKKCRTSKYCKDL